MSKLTRAHPHPHPVYARVTAYRKDVRLPAAPTNRWDEQYSATSEQWSGMWDRSPMRHFGRTVRMIAFRQLFRDLFGDIRIEDEDDARDQPITTAADAAPVAERDWAAEFLETKTIEAIDTLEAEARTARIFTPIAAGTALHRIARNQRKSIVEAAWAGDHAPAATEPAAAAEETTTAPTIERPTPRGYLPPQSRADSRASRRKKGRR